MTLQQIFEQIRSDYVKRFAAAASVRTTKGGQWLVEHTFGPPEEPDESGWDLPMRHDLIPLEDGKPSAVMVITADEEPDFEPFEMKWSGKPLTVGPFTWDECQILVKGLPEDVGWQPLLDWFAEWFDPAGEKEPDEDGLLGVIHAVMPPESDETGEVIVLDVDLGTADVDALAGLFEALHEMGAESITVGKGLVEHDDEEDEEDDDEADEDGDE